jgi:hypothetical protein
MKNVGSVPAVYLVFEFHSPAIVALRRQQEDARKQRQQQEDARKQRQQQADARRLRQQQRQARLAEQQRRKEDKRRRKRGVRGLVRKVVKALRKLGR